MRVDLQNFLHKMFLHLKGGLLIVFALIFGLISFVASNSAFGEGLVPVVQTPVRVLFDKKVKTFVATQNTVEGALEQGGIVLSKNDITEPPRDSLLTGKTIDIKVTRALPVLVSDGNQEQVYYSAYTNAADILKQLDITVYPEDKIDQSLIIDPVDEKTAGQKISITRAPTFTVNVDDGSKIIRSWASTIRDVLSGKINLGKKDIVEPPLENSPVNVDTITITRVNVIEQEETETIPFSTTYKNDYNTYQGQTKLIQAGENGEKKLLVRITYHNGQIVDRSVLGSEVITEPVKQVISKGVKPYNAGVWWDKIIAAANSVGIDGLRMYKMMDCESHGNPFTGTDYIGLFQYGYGTWFKARSDYGGSLYSSALITNGDAQIYVTARKIANEGWGAWPVCAYR